MERMYENVGSDITFEDMMPQDMSSDISDFYKDTNVFLTGATGFIGKLLMEKLLRSCPDINKIYILIRPKKGKDVETRFKEIFQGPNFEPLVRKQPNFIQKIVPFVGDISQPNLGLSDEDKEKLFDTVHCVIHCAATVRFDEKLRIATNINVRSVYEMVSLGKQIKNLKAILYISTAYSQCVHQKIEEKFYDPPITGPKLLSIMDSLDDEKLEKITPILIGDFPNSYVFTKAVAESLILSEGGHLPIGICRPSIVIATVKEPISGWIDNLYGATGVLVGAALGVLRSLHGKRGNVAEMIPADYVINLSVAALWDIASRRSINDNRELKAHEEEDRPIIYNCVSSVEAPITWDLFTKLAEKHAPQVPSTMQVWHYCFAMRANWVWHCIAVFLLHTVPAYLVDFLALCVGRKPILVKGYQKINKFATIISYFAMREWTFTNDNTQKLWQKLNKNDKETFEFSMKNFDWDSYFFTYVRGGRAYLLKDPLETIPEGRKKFLKLQVAHYALCTFLLIVLYKLLSSCFCAIF